MQIYTFGADILFALPLNLPDLTVCVLFSVEKPFHNGAAPETDLHLRMLGFNLTFTFGGCMKKIASAVLAAFLSTALVGAYAAGEPHKPVASAPAKAAQKAKPQAHKHAAQKAPKKQVRQTKKSAKQHVKKTNAQAHKHPVKKAGTVHRDAK